MISNLVAASWACANHPDRQDPCAYCVSLLLFLKLIATATATAIVIVIDIATQDDRVRGERIARPCLVTRHSTF